MNNKLWILCAALLILSSSVLAQTTYYVSTTGTARANGLSAQTPMKDLQKAIDVAVDGSTILIAEGNYLGPQERGYITVGTFANGSDKGKYLKLYGGYSADFAERDIIKHVTKIQPGQASASTMKGALLHITARRPLGYNGPQGEVVVDGITFDFGEVSMYCAPDIYDVRTGTPNEGVQTGRLLEPGAAPVGGSVGYLQSDIYALHLDVEGEIKIQNCTFVNCRDYGIQGILFQGHIDISNNIFVACRYSACQIQGNSSTFDKNELDFHHNTVLFTWTRTKEMADMGQGFCFRNGIRTIDVHNNIFGCSARCGVERTSYETDSKIEAQKQTNLWSNYFFANHFDLEISNGTNTPVNVPASRIVECDEHIIGPKFEYNAEMPENKAFTDAIDEAYIKGFMSIKIVGSSSYNGNTAANQLYRKIILGRQGAEAVRTSMYCNKYPWEKVRNLFGKVNGYGAQVPDNKKW